MDLLIHTRKTRHKSLLDVSDQAKGTIPLLGSLKDRRLTRRRYGSPSVCHLHLACASWTDGLACCSWSFGLLLCGLLLCLSVHLFAQLDLDLTLSSFLIPCFLLWILKTFHLTAEFSLSISDPNPAGSAAALSEHWSSLLFV